MLRRDSSESLKRRAFRERHVHPAEPFDRTQHDSESHRDLGLRPDGKRTAAAGDEYTARLGERGVGACEMQHAEVDRHRIEPRVGKLQLFSVAFLEHQRRMLFPRERDHLG